MLEAGRPRWETNKTRQASGARWSLITLNVNTRRNSQQTREDQSKGDAIDALGLHSILIPYIEKGKMVTIPTEDINVLLKREIEEPGGALYGPSYSSKLLGLFQSAANINLLACCFWFVVMHHFRSSHPRVPQMLRNLSDMMCFSYASVFSKFETTTKEKAQDKDHVFQKYPEAMAHVLYKIFYACFPFSRRMLNSQFKSVLYVDCHWWFTGMKVKNPQFSWLHAHQQTKVLTTWEKNFIKKRNEITAFFGSSEANRSSKGDPNQNTQKDNLLVGANKGKTFNDCNSMEAIRQNLTKWRTVPGSLLEGQVQSKPSQEVDGKRSPRADEEEDTGIVLVGFVELNENPVWVCQDHDDTVLQSRVEDIPGQRSMDLTPDQFVTSSTSPLIHKYVNILTVTNNRLLARNTSQKDVSKQVMLSDDTNFEMLLDSLAKNNSFALSSKHQEWQILSTPLSAHSSKSVAAEGSLTGSRPGSPLSPNSTRVFGDSGLFKSTNKAIDFIDAMKAQVAASTASGGSHPTTPLSGSDCDSDSPTQPTPQPAAALSWDASFKSAGRQGNTLSVPTTPTHKASDRPDSVSTLAPTPCSIQRSLSSLAIPESPTNQNHEQSRQGWSTPKNLLRTALTKGHAQPRSLEGVIPDSVVHDATKIHTPKQQTLRQNLIVPGKNIQVTTKGTMARSSTAIPKTPNAGTTLLGTKPGPAYQTKSMSSGRHTPSRGSTASPTNLSPRSEPHSVKDIVYKMPEMKPKRWIASPKKGSFRKVNPAQAARNDQRQRKVGRTLMNWTKTSAADPDWLAKSKKAREDNSQPMEGGKYMNEETLRKVKKDFHMHQILLSREQQKQLSDTAQAKSKETVDHIQEVISLLKRVNKAELMAGETDGEGEQVHGPQYLIKEYQKLLECIGEKSLLVPLRFREVLSEHSKVYGRKMRDLIRRYTSQNKDEILAKVRAGDTDVTDLIMPENQAIKGGRLKKTIRDTDTNSHRPIQDRKDAIYKKAVMMMEPDQREKLMGGKNENAHFKQHRKDVKEYFEKLKSSKRLGENLQMQLKWDCNEEGLVDPDFESPPGSPHGSDDDEEETQRLLDKLRKATYANLNPPIQLGGRGISAALVPTAAGRQSIISLASGQSSTRGSGEVDTPNLTIATNNVQPSVSPIPSPHTGDSVVSSGTHLVPPLSPSRRRSRALSELRDARLNNITIDTTPASAATTTITTADAATTLNVTTELDTLCTNESAEVEVTVDDLVTPSPIMQIPPSRLSRLGFEEMEYGDLLVSGPVALWRDTKRGLSDSADEMFRLRTEHRLHRKNANKSFAMELSI